MFHLFREIFGSLQRIARKYFRISQFLQFIQFPKAFCILPHLFQSFIRFPVSIIFLRFFQKIHIVAPDPWFLNHRHFFSQKFLILPQSLLFGNKPRFYVFTIQLIELISVFQMKHQTFDIAPSDQPVDLHQSFFLQINRFLYCFFP